MKINRVLFLCFLSWQGFAQVPSTDIFLTDVRKTDGKLIFSTPRNITAREGYDNQPWFSSDSRRMLFVSMTDSTQSDLFVYGIFDSTSTRLTETPESEYSPQYVDDGKSVSAVRVDSDKGQRLYEFTDEFQTTVELTPGLDSIGYYCWINDTTIALACLNNGLELIIYEKNNAQYLPVEKGIGRCLLRIPGTSDLLFVKKENEEVTLMIYSTARGEAGMLAKGMAGVEDYCFLPDGTLLAGRDGKLYGTDIYGSGGWQQLADFSESAGNFYRICSSPDGRRLALVTYPGKKP